MNPASREMHLFNDRALKVHIGTLLLAFLRSMCLRLSDSTITARGRYANSYFIDRQWTVPSPGQHK